MYCPRCKTYLASKTVKDVDISIEVENCTTCGGSWFGKGELSRLEKIIEPVFLEIRKIPRKIDQREPLNCPSCNNLQVLQKAEHARDKKVLIDYCPVCKGVWLDKGELEAIQKENWLITVRSVYNWLMKPEE